MSQLEALDFNLPPGAGMVDLAESEIAKQIFEAARRNALSHYCFFALGAPPMTGKKNWHLEVSDRELGVQYIYRGRLTKFRNIYPIVNNQTEEALTKENAEDQPETIVSTKTAAACADEVQGAYGIRGCRVISCLVGVPDHITPDLEGLILPIVPPTLIKILTELEDNAEGRIEHASLSADMKELCFRLLAEMTSAARASYDWATEYLDVNEGERVDRSKSNGHGRSKADNVDKYYYQQLEREPLQLSLQGTPIGGSATAAPNVIVNLPADYGKQTETIKAHDPKHFRLCPACDEEIKLKAKICKHCHTDVIQYEKQIEEDMRMDLAPSNQDQVVSVDKNASLEEKRAILGLQDIESRKELSVDPNLLAQLDHVDERRAEAREIIKKQEAKPKPANKP